MFIRVFSIFTTLSIALLGLAFFFMSVNPPYDVEKLQELAINKEIDSDNFDELLTQINLVIQKGLIFEYLSSNALVATFILVSAFSFSFGAIHYFLDKLFFKEFYENASVFDAIRRGFFISTGIFIFLYLRLMTARAEEIILSLFIIFLIEILFTVFLRRPVLRFLNKSKKK